MLMTLMAAEMEANHATSEGVAWTGEFDDRNMEVEEESQPNLLPRRKPHIKAARKRITFSFLVGLGMVLVSRNQQNMAKYLESKME